MKRGICRWISHFSNQTLSSLLEIDSNPDNNRLYWRATRNCLMDVESWAQSRMVCVWYHSIRYDKYRRIDDSDILGINVGALLIAPFSHAFVVRGGGRSWGTAEANRAFSNANNGSELRNHNIASTNIPVYKSIWTTRFSEAYSSILF